MYQTIRSYPRQFVEGYDLVSLLRSDFFRGKKFNNLILAGMGGSAFPADLVNDYLEGGNSVTVVRDYRLSAAVTGRDLVVCSSYSGTTEETLAAFDAALTKRIPLLVLTHGGLLAERAKKNKIPLILIPECIQPRYASGYVFSSLLALLEIVGKIPPQGEILKRLSHFLGIRLEGQEKIGAALSKKLVDRIPIIYGPPGLAGTCRVWKIKFNENAKIPSFHNTFPELNHNEMVGFVRLLFKPALIFLTSRFMDKRVAKRMDVMKILLKKEIPILEVQPEGESLLHEMFDSLAIADFASYHLAKETGVDPISVPMIEDFKKRL